MNLSKQFHEHRLEIGELIKRHKNDINKWMIGHDQKLKQVAEYKNQLTTQIETHRT